MSSELQEMTRDHATRLMITGISLGILHVVAGPDHLSALATLAVGSSWKAMSLGVRWGLGHSTGLIAVAIVFIALKGELNLRALGRYCDVLVGIFMVALGLYGIYDTLTIYHKKRYKKDLKELKSVHSIESNNGNNNSNSKLLTISTNDEIDEILSHHDNVKTPIHRSNRYVDIHDPFTQRLVSFSIGLLHGNYLVISV